MFDRLDTNHDGTISREEFAAAHDRRGGVPRGMTMRGRHMGLGSLLDGPAAQRPPVTRAQFIAEGLRRFDAADTNHDGKLSPAERAAAHRQREAGGDRGDVRTSQGNQP